MRHIQRLYCINKSQHFWTYILVLKAWIDCVIDFNERYKITMATRVILMFVFSIRLTEARSLISMQFSDSSVLASH